MSKFFQVALGALVALPLTVTQAAAADCPWYLAWLCGGGGDTGGGTPAVPEIDVSQGLAAVAIVLVVALVMREKFLRSRA